MVRSYASSRVPVISCSPQHRTDEYVLIAYRNGIIYVSVAINDDTPDDINEDIYDEDRTRASFLLLPTIVFLSIFCPTDNSKCNTIPAMATVFHKSTKGTKGRQPSRKASVRFQFRAAICFAVFYLFRAGRRGWRPPSFD